MCPKKFEQQWDLSGIYGKAWVEREKAHHSLGISIWGGVFLFSHNKEGVLLKKNGELAMTKVLQEEMHVQEKFLKS